ncbi:hypothetical protein KUTeg_010451 [Tegillarca granosa]|uniref:Septin-type G domain-containing protein n=1 Tax=Tegillarca granosa TaxID=220873 RepID=A0ABQ9FBN5_TEGGR|nr:hypothetical protein KUTeg_010451 [Tegillarca granosa]
MSFTAENLHASTNYIFKVCTVFGEEKGHYNIHATNEIMTSEERTLMFVGGTGAGKSLMVETIINYVLDVDFCDDFRFSMVDLNESEQRKVDDQSISQTEWITMYQVANMDKSRINYKLNVIDTPGFGDTSGSDADDMLIENIETFFKSDNNLSIDALGFVIEASQCRLNDGQKKLFQKIFSIFGRDFDRNIFLFVTFSDEFEPKVMAAIHAETIPFAGKYKFNNGGLFINTPKSKESFDMAFHSLSEFFHHLSMSRNVSLMQTTENMEKKRQLTATVEGLKPKIQVGYNKLECLRQQVKVIEKHKADVKKNKDFEFSVDLPCKEKIKTGYWSTNCKICEVTCHHPCWHTSDKWNVFCKVMTQSKCGICERRCNSWEHEMSEYTYFEFVKKTKQSFHDLVQKYERVIGGPKQQEQVLKALKDDIMEVWVQIGKAIEKISRLIKEINEIALRRISYTAPQYIDYLMAEENSKGEISIPGKMALLTILKNHAEIKLKRKSTPRWEDIDVDDMLQSWKSETKRLKSLKH